MLTLLLTGFLTFTRLQDLRQEQGLAGQLIANQLAPATEYLLMLGFFVAFAVKFPVVPVHSWLPDAHAQAPTAGSVDLAGILLKTAAYGLLRFALPLFPNASAEFAPIAQWLGVFAILYGALLSFAQTDIKRLVAYSSVSHMGFVLIAIYSGSHIALQGAVVQMMAHGLSAAALFILCGQLYERLHTRDLRQMGGIWARMPWLPAISLFFAAAALGLPGTGNFVGEFLILIGSFQSAPWVTVLAATSCPPSTLYVTSLPVFGLWCATSLLAGTSVIRSRQLQLDKSSGHNSLTTPSARSASRATASVLLLSVSLAA